MTQTASQVTASSIGKWKPYPAYKDSGVEWLGEIPEHWEVMRLKFTCEINPSKSDTLHFPIDMEVSFLPMELIGEDGTISLEKQTSSFMTSRRWGVQTDQPSCQSHSRRLH